jgi:pimeloyl-ACP methyl ester carboxylesterase
VAGAATGRAALPAALAALTPISGWVCVTDTVGVYDKDYLHRSLLTLMGLGANPRAPPLAPPATHPAIGRLGLRVWGKAKGAAVLQTVGVAELIRDGIALAYEEAGQGAASLVFVHGLACHRGFWAAQIKHFSRHYRVLAVDLRGHGHSDAPEQRYTMQLLADDVAWMCSQLGIERPVLVGHSLGGLVALELAVGHREQVRAVTLIDSILLAPGVRAEFVRELVTALRSPDASRALREYYSTFFGPYDDHARKAWILDEIVRTPTHVTSSILEESVRSWDDADALGRCEVPLLYLDAATPNADLARATKLQPRLTVGRTVGSGHFSPCEVPEQINAMLDRFLTVGLDP